MDKQLYSGGIISARSLIRALKVKMCKTELLLLFIISIFLLYTQVVNVLRSQLAQLDEMKRERETLEEEIKAVTFDMSTVFLTSLAQDGAISEEQMSLSKLDQLYGAYNQRVQATLRTQEELLGQIQVNSNTPFGRNIICQKNNSEQKVA